ncbi:MAG: thioredoxin domain-containing protein [Balneolaceae bacterium]|nr:thioredoxin domain-containing protein [Balneolaceae bacterium]
MAQESSSNAEVVLTEYSDFQCPACGYFYPMVEKLKEEYGDKLRVNYRHFPLNSHQFAALAARAAEAAGNQGEFDAMHDRLFENQKSWSSSGNPQSVFTGYAQDIGLDIQQFKNDLNSAETQQTVMEQKKEGQNRGVNSTPTFFVNGDIVQQLPRSYEQFKAIIESAMQESK